MSLSEGNHGPTTATPTGAETVATTTGDDCEGARVHRWRDATSELVLEAAVATTAADQPQSQGSISITLIGQALSVDLLLADTGNIALTALGDHADACRHPMRVVPMRLDLLSDLPAIRVLARGVTKPTQLRLAVELTACNPHTTTRLVIRCEYDSVRLDSHTPLVQLDFELHHGELQHQ